MSDRPAPTALTADDLRRPLGRDVTFLQFSSGFCAPCRATRRVLERVVATGDGIAHVEVDVADRADLATRFAVEQTPTVVLLDAAGEPVARVTGVPTLAGARAAAEAVRPAPAPAAAPAPARPAPPPETPAAPRRVSGR